MPKKSTLSTSPTSLTVTENAGPTPIDIAAPSDSNYAASQLTITVTGLPTDGTVLLADGVTPVTVGETLTVAQLTGLVFKPTSGLFGQTSTFTYKVTDRSGARATGTATLAIGPDVLPTTTVTASLTVAENAAPTPIGIAAPSDPNYAASQLTITVTGLPTDGTVFLADGVTSVTAGEALTVAQLTGLIFKPKSGLFGQSSTFTYKVTDPSGLSATGSATLAIGPDTLQPTTVAAALTAAENAGPTPIGIAAPTDPNYAALQLTVTVTGLPTDGTVFLADGVTPVTAGEILTVAQLTGLEFKPTAGVFGQSSTFTYKVTDPSGLSATGSATLAIGPDMLPPTTVAASLTVAENAAPTGIGIAAPTDPNYVASQLTVTVTGLPSDGTVVLSDGVTRVTVGQTLSVAALTSLLFAPAANLSSASSSFLYTVSDPSGLSVSGSATLAIDPPAGGISPDGSTLMAGSAGTLVTSAGTWTFPGAIFLNGQQVGGSPTQELEVANNGNMYGYNGGRAWYEWVNSAWTPSAAPNSPTPNSTPSPDGSTLMAGSAGTLVTSAGTWTFPGAIFLNGQQVGGSPTQELEVANNGNMYGYNGGSAWYEWVNSAWTPTTNPDPSTSLPTNPLPSPSGTIDTTPVLPQPSQSGDIVGVRLQNTGSAAEPSGYVTFGELFAAGAVTSTDSLVARINGVNYAVQIDVKSTNTDGSVRQAVLTLDAPSIPAGGTLDLMLAKGTAPAPAPAAPSASALLASGYSASVNFTFHNADGTTTTDSASAAAALQAALAAGTVSKWLTGSAVNEYDVTTTVDGGKLKVEFDIRAYANGTTSTDVIFDNSWMFSSGKTDLNYDVSISQGGSQVFSASNVQQYLYSMWDHRVASTGTISPNVQYDVPYLEGTGAIPSYDTSYGVSDAAIQRNYTNIVPMGTGGVDTNMPDTGGRQDIGPQPNWTAQWLLSQNSGAYQVMMANAAASGSIPWHYTDESTGQPVNAQTYPNLFYGTNPVNGSPSYGSTTDPWTPNNAHMPELNYVPYLVSGSHYQLNLLQAEADYAIYSVWGYGTAMDSSGTVPTGFLAFFNQDNPGSNDNQVRAAAWELRSVADAAYATPDNDPLKAYFTNELNIAMKGLVQEYITDNAESGFGQLTGWVGYPAPIGYNGEDMAPWQEDYFVTSLAAVAGMNIPQASSEAVQMLKYMNNFVSGLFINGSNGYNPLDGTAEWISLYSSTGPYNTGAPYTTWSQLYKSNLQTVGSNGYNGVYATPQVFVDWPNQTGGGYAEIAKAALADEITYTQSPQAIQAYGLVVSQIAYAFLLYPSDYSALSGPTVGEAYQNYPQFSIVPRLPDGISLQASQMQIDTSNAATVNLTGAPGQDVLLAVVGSGTATLTSSSAAGGNSLLYGGSGPTTLIAGAGNDYMFGGGSGSSYNYNSSGTALEFGPQQFTTFVVGTGNDYMSGGGGGNIYELKASNSAGPRSTTIANFNINTDQLTVGANIDGSGITSASQLISSATVSNGDTLLYLSPNDTITLLGVSQPSSLLNHIIIS